MPPVPHLRLLPLALTAFLCAVLPASARAEARSATAPPAASSPSRGSSVSGVAQDTAWNASRVLELVALARDVRQSSTEDSTFRSYRARARGFVYFYLDRADEAENTLIKTDQVALDVYWRSPGLTRQRIVGMRDEKVLPTNIRYHLDHLTVVQDDFQDLIRMGDGDEVAAVIHPAAPGAETLYDFRLADSLSLQYVGLDEPVRVYEVQVRPRNPDLPGFIGALYLDRATGAIVRMAFTFTPASYVDPYLDYIRISLDNALWLGRHWLPYRQEVELRRELPQLDFMAGSIIRGRWEVGDYAFNEPIPEALVRGRRVTAAPNPTLERFAFQDSLYADLEDAGLGPSPELGEVREQLREMALSRALDGLRPLRLHLGAVSDVIRRNRAEGWSLGAGLAFNEAERPLRILGGYAIAAERGWARGSLALPLGEATVRISGSWNGLRDIGPISGASGLVNTIATLGGRDYLDPFWVSGGGLGTELPLGSARERRIFGELRVERHESASLTVDDDNTAFRPVRPVVEGTRFVTAVGVEQPDRGNGPHGRVRLSAITQDDGWLRGDIRLGWSDRGPARTLERWITVDAGFTSGNALPQDLFLLGGRGTIPGFPYREAVGDRFVLARGALRHSILEPFASARLTAAAGWTELALQSLPQGWTGDPSAGVRTSLGVGLDLLWNVIQLDMARGFPDGDWEFFVSISPRLTPWL